MSSPHFLPPMFSKSIYNTLLGDALPKRHCIICYSGAMLHRANAANISSTKSEIITRPSKFLSQSYYYLPFLAMLELNTMQANSPSQSCLSGTMPLSSQYNFGSTKMVMYKCLSDRKQSWKAMPHQT